MQHHLKHQALHINFLLEDERNILKGESLGNNIPVSTRKHYAFEGWYEDENFVGEPVKSILPTDTGDKEFYAKCQEILSLKGQKLIKMENL